MTGRFTLTHRLTGNHASTSLRTDVLTGLASRPRTLPPKWFYDARGSALFEEITRLPEYYPTRTEREILAARAPEIAAATGARTLVELGSGASEKTRLLLDALRDAGTLRGYVPVDVSDSALRRSAHRLRVDYPDLDVHAVVADFGQHLGMSGSEAPRVLAFLGSTIGNLLPAERSAFLRRAREELEPGDTLLLGTDLVKDPGTLVAAYDDPAGVTAEFNRNVLAVLNRELGADFDLGAFEHVARWNAEKEWIEMRLRATRELTVKIPAVDLVVSFERGEELLTEVSAKFRPETVRAELADAGLAATHCWTDPADHFALWLATPVPAPVPSPNPGHPAPA
ncbi:L-histidine N(alpha)-methyltransferase [Streptomyces sodiiphilus]|uniref:Histidine N-alpha-methyltransferase n=1 Tax=Streptomyces sodiiphilus TaxID=226217 RepID=A0ABP5AFP6_9ACTN